MMGRINLARLAAALAVLAVAALPARPAAAQAAAESFTPAQRAEIVNILREALHHDPSILREAVAAMQADDARRQEAEASAAIAGAQATLLHDPDDQVAGNPRGDVTVVEFYDPRCPYCRRMLPAFAELLRTDPGVRLVYKDIPVLGPASVLETRALLAAQRQGGYEKLMDVLMKAPPDATLDSVRAAAEKVGLDWPRLQRDMDQPAIRSRIEANLHLADQLGVQGTPAIIIGQRLVAGALELPELRQMVADARGK